MYSVVSRFRLFASESTGPGQLRGGLHSPRGPPPPAVQETHQVQVPYPHTTRFNTTLLPLPHFYHHTATTTTLLRGLSSSEKILVCLDEHSYCCLYSSRSQWSVELPNIECASSGLCSLRRWTSDASNWVGTSTPLWP